ncbi:phosphoribosyltransferase [bacterium]|nr:phosphoribosyltransferase [bacterium]
MNYRSVSDLAATIRAGSSAVPSNVNLIVGIPRSGTLAASLLALHMNHSTCDLESYLRGEEPVHGNTRSPLRSDLHNPELTGRTLVLDDSVASGNTLRLARTRIEEAFPGRECIYGGVFVCESARDATDIAFELLEMPRVFEWNLFHRPDIDQCCVDIDGVLCRDPTNAENDDGVNYQMFMRTVAPLFKPSYPIGHLVTSRLERYRQLTEEWLHNNGINFHHLHMLDLPTAEIRRQQRAHAPFKAKVYSQVRQAQLFVESDPIQAQQIADMSGKAVLCYSDQLMYRPHTVIPRALRAVETRMGRVKRAALRRLRRGRDG